MAGSLLPKVGARTAMGLCDMGTRKQAVEQTKARCAPNDRSAQYDMLPLLSQQAGGFRILYTVSSMGGASQKLLLGHNSIIMRMQKTDAVES